MAWHHVEANRKGLGCDASTNDDRQALRATPTGSLPITGLRRTTGQSRGQDDTMSVFHPSSEAFIRESIQVPRPQMNDRSKEGATRTKAESSPSRAPAVEQPDKHLWTACRALLRTVSIIVE